MPEASPRRAPRRPGPTPPSKSETSLSLFAPFIDFLQQRQHALPLGPIAGAVLNDFLELDLALGHIGDEAEVLAHVVALLDPVERLVGAHDREHVLALREGAHHLELLERECLEGLLAAVEVGRDAPAG